MISWLIVAALCGALIYYIDRPTGWRDIGGAAVLALGWPIAVPFLLVAGAYEKFRERN